MSNDRLLAVAGAVALLAATAPAHAATTELVSANTAGQEGNDNSFDPSLSGDGHYVTFDSIATNLASGVGSDHVFVRDRAARTTTVADVSTGGQLASSFSFDALISRDGSHVAFFSNASNLVAGDTNGRGDVFERDLKTGTTVRVSVKSNGQEPHNSDSYPDAISANGRYIAFETRAPNLTGVRHGPNTIFVHNLATGNTLLVSKGLGGQPANGGSFQAAMSGDGRFVVYDSDATNIVAGNNGKGGVFLWDRHSGQMVRVDVSTSGQQANDAGFRPFVSDDGSVVAFGSEATNLVSGVTDGATLVYVRDLKAGTTTLVSRAVGGGEPNDDVYGYGLSSDGRYVLMQSAATNMVAGDTNGGADDFVYDRQTGTLTVSTSPRAVGKPTRAMPTSPASTGPRSRPTAARSRSRRSRPTSCKATRTARSTSSSARASAPRRPGPQGHNEAGTRIYHRFSILGDAQPRIASREATVRHPTVIVTSTLLLVAASPAAIAATTELVSVTSAGQQANGNSYDPSVSADGSRVGFRSVAANLGGDGLTFRVYVRDRLTFQTIAADTGLGGAPPDGDSSVPLLSRDGSRVVFSSFATNLVPGDTNDRADVFERDLATGTTVRITVTSAGVQANGGSSRPDAVSANGRYVLFESTARNLTHGPKSLGCVFVRDVLKGKTLTVGRGLGGVLPNGSSDGKSISGDGRFVGLESDATNLVAGDTNGASDVFVVDRRTGATLRASVSSTGEQGNGGSYGGYVSDDGSVVAFQTSATNLASNSPRGGIMVRDLKAGTTVRVDRATDGGEPNGPTGLRGMSANGRFVLMFSLATNLVAGDANNASDVFVYDRQLGKISRVDLAADGSEANLGANESSFPSISPDGSAVGFDSASTNLVPGGTNGLNQAFVRLLTPTPPRGPATRMR